MYRYVADFSRNYKHRISEMLDIAHQFVDTPIGIETIIKFYMRNNSRIIICFDEDKIIGVYLYTSGSSFFSRQENGKYLYSVLQGLNIKSNQCTVSIFAVVDKKYPKEIYYDMNKIKVTDAKQQGYLCSIVNINAEAPSENSDFCQMSNFSLIKQDFFSQLTDTKIETTKLKNERGVDIVIQYY